MKNKILATISMMAMTQISLAKGRELTPMLTCNLSTRTQVTETRLYFNDELNEVKLSQQVTYDYKNEYHAPFYFLIGANRNNHSEVEVSKTDTSLIVNAYESSPGGRAPQLIKEFEMEAKNLGLGNFLVKKLVVNGRSLVGSIGLCTFRY